MASGAPSPAQDDPFADRRVYPRVPVALPAFLQANGKRYSVQILDLSAGGARLSCSERMATGTAVVLDCGTLGRGAVIRWQNGDSVGLCFDRELDPRDVAALAGRSQALDSLMKSRDG